MARSRCGARASVSTVVEPLLELGLDVLVVCPRTLFLIYFAALLAHAQVPHEIRARLTEFWLLSYGQSHESSIVTVVEAIAWNFPYRWTLATQQRTPNFSSGIPPPSAHHMGRLGRGQYLEDGVVQAELLRVEVEVSLRDIVDSADFVGSARCAPVLIVDVFRRFDTFVRTADILV